MAKKGSTAYLSYLSEPITIGTDQWRLWIRSDGGSLRTGFDFRPLAWARGFGEQWRGASEHHRPPLAELEALRDQHRQIINAMTPEGLRHRRTDDQPRPTELTPEGEQYVIPGAERRTTPKARQLDLWG